TASPKALLGSVERPFAGASAVPLPGATLRHRTGLVPPSCRRRLNRANGQLGSPRNLGCPPHTTPRDTTGHTGSARPIVAVAALLQWGRWPQQRCDHSCGEPPCLTQPSASSPPAPADRSATPADASLADPAGERSPTCPSGAQPAPRPATADDSAGGA